MDEIFNKFDISSVVDWIKSNDFKKVGLQYSRDLIKYYSKVNSVLRKEMREVNFYNFVQFRFSDCCIDVLGMDKLQLDAMVHFGYSCLSPLSNDIIVKNIFTYCEMECDIASFTDKIYQFLNSENIDCVTIVYEFRLRDVCQNIYDQVTRNCKCVHFSKLYDGSKSVEKNWIKIGRRIISKDCENLNGIIMYVCSSYDLHAKANILPLYHLQKSIYVFSLNDLSIKNVTNEIKGLIMRRIKHIQIAKESLKIALLSLNDTHENHKDFFYYLRNILEKCGKDICLFQNRRPINMNSIPNLDSIVYITCSDGSMDYAEKHVIDEQGIIYPMITPFEILCACFPNKFDNNFLVNRYITDIGELMEPEHLIDDTVINENLDDEFSFSLNNGKICRTKAPVDGNIHCAEANSLVPRLDSDWTISALGRENRSYYGLDPKIGMHAASEIIEGQSGIASTYISEPK